jgi:hypothetical protein
MMRRRQTIKKRNLILHKVLLLEQGETSAGRQKEIGSTGEKKKQKKEEKKQTLKHEKLTENLRMNEN